MRSRVRLSHSASTYANQIFLKRSSCERKKVVLQVNPHFLSRFFQRWIAPKEQCTWRKVPRRAYLASAVSMQMGCPCCARGTHNVWKGLKMIHVPGTQLLLWLIWTRHKSSTWLLRSLLPVCSGADAETACRFYFSPIMTYDTVSSP